MEGAHCRASALYWSHSAAEVACRNRKLKAGSRPESLAFLGSSLTKSGCFIIQPGLFTRLNSSPAWPLHPHAHLENTNLTMRITNLLAQSDESYYVIRKYYNRRFSNALITYTEDCSFIILLKICKNQLNHFNVFQ